MGWSDCELKLTAIPGPLPVWFAVKIPKLELTIWTGVALPARPLNVTTMEAAPSGALDGMIALICVGLT